MCVYAQTDWGVIVEGKMRGCGGRFRRWCVGRDRCMGVWTGMHREMGCVYICRNRNGCEEGETEYGSVYVETGVCV